MSIGYLKLFRQTKTNPIVMKDADHLAIWIWLLMEAKFAPCPSSFEGKKIVLQPGQLITGRKKIAEQLRVTESKVQRVLKCFENERMIEQQTSPRNRLITIVAWDKYQANEQASEQQMNNKRTTNEQQVNTIKRNKEYKNKRIINNNKKESEELSVREKKEILQMMGL